MPSLPQRDPSTTRAAELAEVRSRYRWDHDYLAPYPSLKIEGIEETGPLHFADILFGSIEGLPAEEQPSIEFVLAKVESSLAPAFEFMSRVPMAEWVKAAAAVHKSVRANVDDWLHELADGLSAETSEREQGGLALPSSDTLLATLQRTLVRAVGEIGVNLDENRSIVGRVVGLVDAFFGDEDKELDAESAREAAARAVEAGLDPRVAILLLPFQAALNFSAKMGTYTLLPEGQVPSRDQLSSYMYDPETVDLTADDLAFGRYPLAGPNPVVIERVRQPDGIPEGFGVGDEHLRAALAAHGEAGAESISLAEAIAAGCLYLTDFDILADIPCRSGPDIDFWSVDLGPETARQRYLPAPFGLFYRGERGLLPVAIQLGRDRAQFEVFTPADEPALWARVKMLYLVAEMNHQEIVSHLSGAHFILEGFVVASARQLHADHPIARFLKPHTKFLLWNDFLGRQILVNPRGFLEQVMPGVLDEGSLELIRRYYRQWDFGDMVFPDALARRGVDDPALLPEYPFRDDGLELWKALRAFVADYLAIYYVDPPADIAADTELQAWLAELRADEGAHVAGLPELVEDLDTLTDIVTAIAFRSSVYHSAINYAQYDFFSYPERIPSMACADPREVRSRKREDYLHSGEVALTQMSLAWVLAGLRDDALVDYELSWFDDPEVWPLVARLRGELAQIEARIELANSEQRSAPYRYLLPSLVTACANV